MPLYDYQCKKCGDVFSKKLMIADNKLPTETPCAVDDCGGEISMVIGAPQIVSGVRTHASAPEGFKDVLRTIKKTSGKGNTIDV